MTVQLGDGSYRRHYAKSKALMEELETYEKGTDVRIPAAHMPQPIRYTFGFVLEEDPQMFPNTDIAAFYGFNSIAVLPEEE